MIASSSTERTVDLDASINLPFAFWYYAGGHFHGGARSLDPVALAPGFLRASSCQGTPLQMAEASEVVDEVRHSDFHPRPRQADRVDEEVHAVLLVGEDVLDGSA